MKLIKILFIQGLIDAWNFRDLARTTFNFGVKNNLTDVWYAKIMIKNYFRILFNFLLNVIILCFLFHEVYGVYYCSL